MRDGWRPAALGTVAALDIEKVPVLAGTTYQIAGVLNGGQGMLQREPIDGSDTNYPTLHRLRSRQMVMRKLTAWEGPITIVPEEYDGHFVSTEFPTFSLDQQVLLPEFMQLQCQQPQFWDQMRSASTGTVQRRKRVNPSQLLEIEILLPPIKEQRRIVDLIGAVDRVDLAARTVARASREVGIDVTSETYSAPDGPTLAEICEITPGYAFRSADFAEASDGIRLLRGDNIEPGSLRWRDAKRLPAWALRANHERFALAEGDIVLAMDRPWIAGGLRRAVVTSDDLPAYVVQRVARIRPVDPALRDFIYAALGSSKFEHYVKSEQTGSHVPHISAGQIGRFCIPHVPIDRLHQVGQVAMAATTAARDASELAESCGVLRTALFGDLLSGRYEIPSSYDELLERAS